MSALAIEAVSFCHASLTGKRYSGKRGQRQRPNSLLRSE